jgi:hypothetical protein
MFLENVLRKYIYFIFIINLYKKSAMMTKKVCASEGASLPLFDSHSLVGHSGHWALGSHLCLKRMAAE